MNNSNDNGKGWALGFGLLAGIAIGYYLNSNEGRAMRRKAQVQFDEYGNQISEYGTELSHRANQLADDAKERGQQYIHQAKEGIESGKEWVSETAETLKQTATEKAQALRDTAGDAVEGVENSFKRGMEKAKAKVNKA